MKKKVTYWEYGQKKTALVDVDRRWSGSDNGGRRSRRGFTQSNIGKPVSATEYEDGSSVVHCGGPCGNLYVDKFGNT